MNFKFELFFILFSLLLNMTFTVRQTVERRSVFFLYPPKNGNMLTPSSDVGKQSSDIKLHRQKRYILFPEGSSFQLVFDLIIPIVDYTNFAIMGITCAVAWELPSKPASEIVEDFRKKLNDGTAGLSRRVDERTNTYQRSESHYKNQDRYRHISSTSPFRYANGVNTSKTNQYSLQGFMVGRNNLRLRRKCLGSRSQRPSMSYTEKDENWKLEQEISLRQYRSLHRSNHKSNHKMLVVLPKHKIYPVYRKRRARTLNSYNDPLKVKLNRIHINQHLRSREDFFRKIVNLYKIHGANGTACILQTICKFNSYHISRKNAPSNFVTEIMRSVFTLPQKSSFFLEFVEYRIQDITNKDCEYEFKDCLNNFYTNNNLK